MRVGYRSLPGVKSTCTRWTSHAVLVYYYLIKSRPARRLAQCSRRWRAAADARRPFRRRHVEMESMYSYLHVAPFQRFVPAMGQCTAPVGPPIWARQTLPVRLRRWSPSFQWARWLHAANSPARAALELPHERATQRCGSLSRLSRCQRWHASPVSQQPSTNRGASSLWLKATHTRPPSPFPHATQGRTYHIW